MNIPRLNSIIGAQFYKSLFIFNTIRTFYIDDDIADALSVSYEEKQRTAEWFEQRYKEAIRWQEMQRR